VLLKTLFDIDGLPWGALDAGIISSVVPPTLFGLQQFFKRHCGGSALVVGVGIKTGMPILYENPREVGADRIVNAVAAYDELKAGCIVVDFGTATTWDVVSPRGEYLGGVIAPGITISSEALYEHAAKLPRVELARPRQGRRAQHHRVDAGRPWSTATPAWSTRWSSGSAARSTSRLAALRPGGWRR